MRHSHGVDTEVGRLRTVLVHRPGAELTRVTPRTSQRLGYSRLPWVSLAQREHDTLAEVLREHHVEVLYVTELLQDTLEYLSARDEAIGSVLSDPRLGDRLRKDLRSHLAGLDPEDLAQVLVAGLTAEEFRPGRGLVYSLLDRYDFVIWPLPHLVFTRDSSLWFGDAAAVAGPGGGARRREAELVRILYGRHPRFAGTSRADGPYLAEVDGGDVLALAPGVFAVGVTDQTTPASIERLCQGLFDAGHAWTAVVVPLTRACPGTRLDTVCTLIDADTVLMPPALAYTLRAHTVTPGPAGLRASRPQPFLEAMARAMGVDALTVISTGLDPPAGSRQQWDDGGNALAVAPRLLVCHERTVATNARLEAAGVEVIQVPGSELGSGRGGPRSMACAISRDRRAAGTAETRLVPDRAARPVPDGTLPGLVPAAAGRRAPVTASGTTLR